MIEFTILFALGFLAALLLVLMLAPAIKRRIVAYTEKRLYATMPISPTEVRAQKDMARALYAAENARLRQELDDERQRSIQLRVRHDDEEVFHRSLESNKQELQSQLSTLEGEVNSLQDHLQAKQDENATLSKKLMISEEVATQRVQEISALKTKVKHIARELDEVKLQLASRSIEVEQERSLARTFKIERDVMHKELSNAEAKNKDVAEKITVESRRASLLEQKLADKTVKDAETEILLERRTNEIARLKSRLRAATTKVAGKGHGTLVEDEPYEGANSNRDADKDMTERQGDEAALEQIRQRSEALSQRLVQAKDSSNDTILREDMAQLAADMLALTAAREGDASPIHALLNSTDDNEPSGSLASRAKHGISANRG